MPIFAYQAVNESGKKVKGVIDADSLLLAKEKLQKASLFPLQLSAHIEKKKELILTPAQRLVFTRELGQLLTAGLPLYESLVTLEEKQRSSKLHPLYLDLADALKSGASLSSALKRYPKTFDTIYLSLVVAGEQSGHLPQVFQQLTLLLSKDQRLKKELFSALAYPLFLASFCLLLVLALFLFVIPSLQELFEGRRLHPLTQTVLTLSHLTRDYGWLFLGSLALIGTALTLFFRRKQGALLLSKWLFRLPALHSLLLHASLVRFFRCSAFLLEGGVPLLSALTLAKGVVKWRVVEEAMENACKKIEEGEKLSKQFFSSKLIPPMVPRMVAIAEETGKMSPAFQNIASIYEEELERSLAQITTLLQPALLLLLGLVVGVVLLSILLPLTDVNSFLSS